MVENIITGVVLTTICVLGFLGNSVTLLILNSNHQMRNQPINIYLTVLALFDNGVLFNAVLMLGIPGIYKLMHEQEVSYAYLDESDPLSFDQTFPSRPDAAPAATRHPDLTRALTALMLISRYNSTSFNAGSESSQLSLSTASSLSTSSLSSSRSLSLATSSAASQYPTSHVHSKTHFSSLQTTAGAETLQASQPNSILSQSSPSPHASLSSSLFSSSQAPAPFSPSTARLTTGQKSGREERSATEDSASSRLFNSRPQSSPSICSNCSLNQRKSATSSSFVDLQGSSFASLSTSSLVESSTASTFVSASPSLWYSVDTEQAKHSIKHPELEPEVFLNYSVMTSLNKFAELISSRSSPGSVSNGTHAEQTSPGSPTRTRQGNVMRNFSQEMSSPHSGRTRVTRDGEALLFEDKISGAVEDASARYPYLHRGSVRKDGETANSRLLDENGLFAGSEILYPSEDDMDPMSSNVSASEGPLHLYIQFVYPLALISQTGSIWTTCLITAERYFAIAYPLRALTLSTRKRATWALITMSILAVVYNLPRFAEVEIIGATEDAVVKNIIRPSALRNNRIYYWVYYICAHLALLYIIPLSLLSVLNTKIYLAIKRANRDRSSLTQNQESEMNIATMLVFLVAIFIACNLPAFVVNCLELVYQHNSPYFITAVLFSNFLVCFNSSVNFVIYCTFGKKFRERLHDTFSCSSERLPRRATPIRNRKTSIVAETLV